MPFKKDDRKTYSYWAGGGNGEYSNPYYDAVGLFNPAIINDPTLKPVIVSGRAPAAPLGTQIDIWGDNSEWLQAATNQKIDIVSTSVIDGPNTVPFGSRGALTVRCYGIKYRIVGGLPDTWNDVEEWTDVELDGTTSVPIPGKWIAIHRMEVVESDLEGPNVGTITATHRYDLITGGPATHCIIQAMAGESQSAIYALGYQETAYVTGFYGSILRANQSLTNIGYADFSLVYNSTPDSLVSNTVAVKTSVGCATNGNNPFKFKFDPYAKFVGPGIIQLKVSASVANADISGGFDILKTPS